MADDANDITTGRLRVFDRAVRAKSNKYIWSGVAFLLIGLLVFIFTVAFVPTSNRLDILLFGLGVLLIIIGIVRMLIGIISPATPLDTATIAEEVPEKEFLPDVPPPVVEPEDE